MGLVFRSSWKTGKENGLCRLQLLRLTSALHARRSGHEFQIALISRNFSHFTGSTVVSALFQPHKPAPKYDTVHRSEIQRHH